jgi:hypothetical protein
MNLLFTEKAVIVLFLYVKHKFVRALLQKLCQSSKILYRDRSPQLCKEKTIKGQLDAIRLGFNKRIQLQDFLAKVCRGFKICSVNSLK